MRKYVIAIVALLSVICVCEAEAQFRYGPMAGVSFTDLKFKQNLVTIDKGTGPTAGLATEMMFPGIGFGIDAGVLYSMKGATINLGEREIWSSLGYGSERSYLHCLDIPINLRFKYTNMGGIEEYVAPFVFAGPEFSFLLGHNKVDALKYAAGTLSLTVGLGFEVMKHWQISACRTWGMTYAIKTKLLDDFSAKNQSWNIRLAYLF